MNTDPYRTLGVAYDAEDIVVRAAYKALAQRYHPDKWQGSQQAAHARMAEINNAYSILSDPIKRRAYDQDSARSRSTPEFESDPDPDVEAAFDIALEELNERWKVAVSIFPDLVALKQELAKYSHSLAFAFVTTILESKKYHERLQIANAMEQAFLQRYFGTNSSIAEFAKTLIRGGLREAALMLNRLVDVLGSEVAPELLINKVEEETGIARTRRESEEARTRRQHLLQMVAQVHLDDYEHAARLAKALGFVVREVQGGFWNGPGIAVTTPSKDALEFKNMTAFIYWVKSTLCPMV